MLPEIYDKPVVFTVGGKALVNFMLAALGKDGHYRVLRANNARLGKQGVTPYWGFRLRLMPGEDVEVEGNGKSSEVTKIITDIPREISDEFLAAHHVGEYRQLVQDEIRASKSSVPWSMEESEKIYGGAASDEDPVVGSSLYSDEECYDHPFDSGDYDEGGYPDKPQAKQPSNGLKRLSDAELKDIPGTANVAQRRALQNLGNLELAQKANLSKEEAGAAITAANKKR
jgi:hypothetical protein